MLIKKIYNGIINRPRNDIEYYFDDLFTAWLLHQTENQNISNIVILLFVIRALGGSKAMWRFTITQSNNKTANGMCLCLGCMLWYAIHPQIPNKSILTSAESKPKQKVGLLNTNHVCFSILWCLYALGIISLQQCEHFWIQCLITAFAPDLMLKYEYACYSFQRADTVL